MIPLCRWPFPSALWFSLVGRRWTHSRTYPANPLFEFRLRLEHYPTVPSRPAAARPTPLMGFASLQHIQGTKVHLPRALPARFVPPPGFGYPLDGFLPSYPRRSCFIPTALLGFALRSIPLPRDSRAFPLARPTYRFTLPSSHRRGGRPAGKAAVPGFDPLRSPWRTGPLLTHRCAGCSLGIPPSRALRRTPCPGLHPDSSHVLSEPRP
jgi:hypothetical protein